MGEEADSGEAGFYYEIPGGLLVQDVIEITGSFYGEQIVIQILAGKNARYALPLQLTLTSQGKWTTMASSQGVANQVQSDTCAPIQNFQIRIVTLDSAFEIHLNKNHVCTQKHLVPLPQVTHIFIDGDADFTGVEFKDFYSEKDTSTHNNTSLSEPEIKPGFTRLSENRSSFNRKPKSPILVPTHGSFPNKLATTREEPTVSFRVEYGQQPIVRDTITAEPVREAFVQEAPTSSKRVSHSSIGSLSGRHSNDHIHDQNSKHKNLREKLHLKRGSKSSIPTAVLQENQHATAGGLEGGWVEQGEREVNADGAFYVAGAVSVPNLNKEPGKEKKSFGIIRGSKKSRSISSLPADDGSKLEGKDKAKRYLGGIHISKGSKRDSMTEKESKKKSPFGRKHSESHKGLNKDVPSAGAYVLTEKKVTSEHVNPSLVADTNKKLSSSIPHDSPLIHSAKKTYNLEEAQQSYDIQHGTYQRTPANAAFAIAAPLSSLSSTGESRSHSRSLSRSTSTTSGASTNANVAPSVEHPFYLAGTGGVTLMGKNNAKRNKEKLKGDPPEIANNFLQGKRGMSNDYITYTGVPASVPLDLTHKGVKSTNGVGLINPIGARDSYSFASTSDIPPETYRTKPNTQWDSQPSIERISESGLQQSRPADGHIHGSGAVITTPVTKKMDHKHLLKGESSEIASNLVIKEGGQVHGKIYDGGNPLCGINGVNMPWKLNATNMNAQPVPYGIMKAGSRYSYSSNSLNNLDTYKRSSGHFAISATHGENALHTAAPFTTETDLYNSRSSTLPISSGATLGAPSAGLSATLPVAGVITMRDGKKNQDGKENKQSRVSGFFRRIFRRRRKSGASHSDLEEVGISESVGMDDEMVEQGSSSQMSLDTEEYDFDITAKPHEYCRYASQLRGSLPALGSDSPIYHMCDGQMLAYPLTLSAADIPVGIRGNYMHSIPIQRAESIESWSSVSPGGSRRHYRRSSRHRPESLSSWSSISLGGSHRHRRRSKAFFSGGAKHDLSSSDDDNIKMKQQIPAYTALPVQNRDQSYDSYFTVEKQATRVVYAARPKSGSSSSSNSSITSLYGRVLIVGKSSDFQTRLQSYRKRMDMSKNSQGHKGAHRIGASGYDSSSSNSSVSSITSNDQSRSVVNAREERYTIFDNAGDSVVEKRPRGIGYTYINGQWY